MLTYFIDWTPIGARFSNNVLQALMVLIKKRPPKVSSPNGEPGVLTRANTFATEPPTTGHRNDFESPDAYRDGDDDYFRH